MSVISVPLDWRKSTGLVSILAILTFNIPWTNWKRKAIGNFTKDFINNVVTLIN